MCAISHISHFKIRRVSQPCAHVPVDGLCSILSAQANINLRCRLWICELLRDNGIFILPAGFLFEQFLVLDPVGSSNIDVRQTSITSHLTTFYHTWPVWQASKGKRGRGEFWRSWNGVKSARFPPLPISPFNACTQAEWSPRSSCFCCHAVWCGAVHDVKDTAT